MTAGPDRKRQLLKMEGKGKAEYSFEVMSNCKILREERSLDYRYQQPSFLAYFFSTEGDLNKKKLWGWGGCIRETILKLKC